MRVDRTRLNKRTVEALIKAGAFDSLQRNRAALVASIDRAFEFANATLANANQGGLFDMGDGDDHGSSTQEPDLVDATPWGVKEQLTLEKTAVGFYLSGHLFDEVSREIRQFIRRSLDEVTDSREPQLLAGIVTDFRVINGQRGKLGLFKLDDKSGVIEARADEALINANRNLLKDDELVIVMGKLQPDRFSGGIAADRDPGVGPGHRTLPFRQVPARDGQWRGTRHPAPGQGISGAPRDDRAGRTPARLARAPEVGAAAGGGWRQRRAATR